MPSGRGHNASLLMWGIKSPRKGACMKDLKWYVFITAFMLYCIVRIETNTHTLSVIDQNCKAVAEQTTGDSY